MSTALDRITWQPAIFAETLNRLAILRLRAEPYKDAPMLRVLRNHSFEGVASVLPAFLRFADVPLSVQLSDYDDSLTLPEGAAAAELIWLDFDRYGRLGDVELEAWILERLAALRATSAAPIIVANCPDPGPRAARLNTAIAAWGQSAPGVAILRLDQIAAGQGEAFFDPARVASTGTRLSDAAALEVARRLGLDLLAGLFAPPIKAIAIDLDNTLYDGVLGEDGVAGLVLSDGHARLQRRLADWGRQGVLLGILSRNALADVDALFETRTDFPLGKDDLADWQVGWTGKAEALGRMAARFNIHPDSVLFLDDNLGELAEVAITEPGVRLLHAGAEAADTARALDLYPGLPRGAVTFAGRAADIAANTARRDLAAKHDEGSYLAALQAVLTFSLSPAEDRARLAELSAKTNQFNLALRRYGDLAVDEILRAPDRGVIHVRLADRLSDSGSVAALFFRRDGDYLVVDELIISCRALGRKLEDLMVTEALRRALTELPAARIRFDFVTGPRNQPALEWLAAFTGTSPRQAEGSLDFDRPLPPPRPGVTVAWTN